MIAKRVLIHTINYFKWIDNDGRGETYDTGQIVENVRVEPISKVMTTGGGDEWIAKTLIFYDLNYSTSVDIVENSKIEFVNPQGKTETYYIRQIDVLYSRKNHHLEIYCS